MKKVTLIISTILMLNFVACGTNSSKEAQELLQRILTLVGIPQSIVVNICQDDNDNGVCEDIELQAKLTINKGDNLETILQKVQFTEDGKYLLEHHDPSKKIIMEIQDKEHLKHNNGELSFVYNPMTQELSIFQAMIDAGYLKDSDVEAVKKMKNRDALDKILLESLFENQNTLVDNGMTTNNAIQNNLGEIADSLLALDLNGTLPSDIDNCDGNQTCIDNILNPVKEELILKKEEAYAIAEDNRTQEEKLFNDTIVREEFKCSESPTDVRVVQHYGFEDIFSKSNGNESPYDNNGSTEPYTFNQNISNFPKNINKGMFYIGIESNQSSSSLSVGKYSSSLGSLGSNWSRSRPNQFVDVYSSSYSGIELSSEDNNTLLTHVREYNSFDVLVGDRAGVDFITVATCSLGFKELDGKTFYMVKQGSSNSQKLSPTRFQKRAEICILEQMYGESTVTQQSWTYHDDDNWTKGCSTDYGDGIDIPYNTYNGVINWFGGKVYELESVSSGQYAISENGESSSFLLSKSVVNGMLEPEPIIAPSEDNNESEEEEEDDPAPVTKTEKNVADGYIIKLSSPATASCQNGSSTFTSSQTVGAKGQILFDGVTLGGDCIITVPSGAIIDSNNNGSFDGADKRLLFPMRGVANGSFITPLTTLLLDKKEKGENVSAFEAMVKDFDPVAASANLTTKSGAEKTKIQKLIVLTEILKTAMKEHADISDINLSQIITTDSGETIESLDLNQLVAGFPATIQSRASSKADIIKNLVVLLDSMDTSKICLHTFLVSISDGEKTITEAINEALKVSIPLTSPVTNPFDFIAKSGFNISSELNSTNSMILSLIDSRSFITVWKTDNNSSESSAYNQIAITTYPGESYNYRIDWGDGDKDTDVTGDINHTYSSAGTYTVKISGEFPRFYAYGKRVWGQYKWTPGYYNDKCEYIDGNGSQDYNITSDAKKLIAIEQWGDIEWKSMNKAFYDCSNLEGNGTIDTPNLSNVTDMSYMFYNASKFNMNIADWNVSNVTNMDGLFARASSFNQDISSWDVSNVTIMGNGWGMFEQADAFNQDISSWDVSNVTNMRWMFNGADSFNQNIADWNVSNVTDMSIMFAGTNFNQDISSWNVSNVTNMSNMFESANAFNQDISSWNVSNVTNMSWMFESANAFNQDISSWNVSNVTNMSWMFSYANNFNISITNWDVSKVTDMQFMFAHKDNFNQDISGWDVSNVKYMDGMFEYTPFNQDISQWDMSKVASMSQMFSGNSEFNQSIGGWTLSNLGNIDNDEFCRNHHGPIRGLDYMFSYATSFDQDIGNWNVEKEKHMAGMFDGVTLSTTNYDNLLVGWSGQALEHNVTFSGGHSKYSSTNGESARQTIIDSFDWNITDGGLE